jgi:uncharacterized OB-fold protein
MNSPVKIWRNQKKVASLLGRSGKIISWTVIRVPPGGFSDQAPYPVALVALDGGGRLAVQLVDWQSEDLVIGRKVYTVLRRVIHPDIDGIIPYGIKVKPL